MFQNEGGRRSRCLLLPCQRPRFGVERRQYYELKSKRKKQRFQQALLLAVEVVALEKKNPKSC